MIGRSAGPIVFAVEDTAAQVTWSSLPPGEVVLGAGDAEARVEVASAGVPGAVALEGLTPGHEYDLRMTIDGRHSVVCRFKTLRPPPGDLLCRFATISDTHVGERSFGLAPRVREERGVLTAEAYPARCARAALAEALAWEPCHIVAKGDLTWSGRPVQWRTIGEILASSPVPVSATLGNHDVGPKSLDGRAALAAEGIRVPRGPEAVDLPGVRIVVGHSADHGYRHGVVDAEAREAIVTLVADAPGPAFLAMHHYVDPLPFPSRYPRGIPRSQGTILLREVAEANPATFVSFGHSHRHRRRTTHGMAVTEVGSTKDHPGVWAGYAVHEGGIRQVVRRVADPDCIEWTERTAAVLGGFWGWWTPGPLSWRCFSWGWPRR